ncbi:MAG TPA: HNH endonuclease signature motif containing protein [Vicinamibacterales bacterium]|nr:HNH endonuclease signature motif containing protein [Vicinamibacterales bacterium]
MHHRKRDENLAKMRAYYARRFFWGRAMKLRGPERATVRDLARMWKRQRGRCALTGRRLDRTAQLDHIVPKARGGTDAAANLRWTCEAVNIAKRHMTDAELFALCGDVMAWIGRRIQMVEDVRLEAAS